MTFNKCQKIKSLVESTKNEEEPLLTMKLKVDILSCLRRAAMEYQRIKKVAIIGGGIAGLTIALFLERKGVSVVIYEKNAKIIHNGGGLGIWPNGSQVLHKLFEQDISKLSGQLDLINVSTPTEKNITTTPISIYQEIAPYPNLLLLFTGKILKMLNKIIIQ